MMKPYRAVSNLVGFTLFVQVILGGLATVYSHDYENVHIVWGIISFVVLIVATVFAVRSFGKKSALFRVGVAAIVDFVIQIALGIGILASYNAITVVVHLTNAFVLGVLVTYLISFADAADKATLTVATTKPM